MINYSKSDNKWLKRINAKIEVMHKQQEQKAYDKLFNSMLEKFSDNLNSGYVFHEVMTLEEKRIIFNKLLQIS